MKFDYQEGLNGGILILFALWIWWQTTYFPNLEEGYPGPALFPRLVGLGFAFSGLVLLIRAWRGSEEVLSSTTSRTGLLRLAAGIGLIILYPFLQPHLSFAPTLGLVCFGVALLLGVRIWIAGLTALLTVLFIFLTFNQLLNVPL